MLRVVDYREADRILDILTPDLGLISASARGARRQKSPLLHATQAMGFCDFDLFYHARSQMYSVDAASPVTAFRNIQDDIVRLVCASHLLELMGDAARDDHAGARDLFRLMAVTLAALDRPDRDPMLVVRTMEMRLMCDIGFTPILDECAVCGNPLPDTGVRFGMSSCGTVCGRPACRRIGGDALPVPPGTLAGLRYIRDAEVDRLFHFRLDRSEQDALSELSERYVSSQMEKGYHRLDMLSSL